MAIAATVPNVTVLADGTEAEIENALTAERKLEETLPELERKKAEARREFILLLAKELVAGPLNVDSLVNKHKSWKTTDDGFEERLKALKGILVINKSRIDDFKRGSTPALRKVLERHLKLIEDQIKAQGKGVKLLQAQKSEIQKRLGELRDSKRK